MLDVGCTGMNQCDPLQVSTLPPKLMLGVGRPLADSGCLWENFFKVQS